MIKTIMNIFFPKKHVCDENLLRAKLNYSLSREGWLLRALEMAVEGEDAAWNLKHYNDFFREGYEKERIRE